MSNLNPIKVDEAEVQTPLLIATSLKDKIISMGVTILLESEGWVYQPSCQIFLNGNDIYPASAPEPVRLTLGKASNLFGKLLLVRSTFALIKPQGGATGNPPTYIYNLSFYAGDTLIESFDMSSGDNNPTDFNSLSLFTLI